MHDTDTIQSLIGQLATHRRTLEICLQQLAAHTPASAPPILFHTISQARKEIALLKHDLAAMGMPVADVPSDTPTPEEEIKHKAVGESQVISGDGNIQAINSQVAVTHVAGDIVYGDKLISSTVINPEPDPLPPIDPGQAQARFAALPEEIVPKPATLPPGSRMPLTSNPLFTGRETDLKQLVQALKHQHTSVVVAGMGGVGKTSLAVEFAHRYGQFFAGGVFWLSFAEEANIPAEIADCGGAGGMRLPGFAKLELADKVRRVLAEWTSDIPHLLIFDNCEDLALVRKYRPSSGASRILITSRDRTWEESLVDHVLALGVLAAGESVTLLRRFRPALSDREAIHVAEEMGHLPLGLHLTGSFLKRYGRVSVGEYLQELSNVSLKHPALEGRGIKDKPIERDMNLARAFAVSYERLDPQHIVDQLAIALLARAAHFAPGEALPRELLLESMPIEEHGQISMYDRDDALERLYALGLLDNEGDAVRLHRLVAAFILATAKDTAAQGAVEQAMNATATRLNDAGLPVPLIGLQPHLRHITDKAQVRNDHQAARLCNNLGYYLDSIADYTAARPYYERALAIVEHVLGPHHLDTATSLSNLGLLHKSQGAYEAARPYLERALAIWEQALGPTHPLTATSLNNLGGLFDSQGAYEAARPYYERALAIREQVLGPTHPDTALSLNNLGLLLKSQGAYAAAQPYYERALALREQVMGPNHPLTALSLNNLGSLLKSQGAYAEAQPYYERALAIWEQLLGPTHSASRTALHQQDRFLSNQTPSAATQPSYERALAIWEQALDPAHPDTTSSLNELGLLLKSQAAYETARPYLERTLAITELALSLDHANTAASQGNLGDLLRSQGAYDVAWPYLQRALAITEQALGSAHPDTATSLSNLGALLYEQGAYDAARPCLERALAIYEQVLGASHPDTATSLTNLGLLLNSQGAYAEAQLYLERALAIREHVLGTSHPDTALSLNNLAILYYYQQRFAEAATLMRRALAIREHVLGNENSRSASSRQSLVVIEQHLNHEAG